MDLVRRGWYRSLGALFGSLTRCFSGIVPRTRTATALFAGPVVGRWPWTCCLLRTMATRLAGVMPDPASRRLSCVGGEICMALKPATSRLPAGRYTQAGRSPVAAARRQLAGISLCTLGGYSLEVMGALGSVGEFGPLGRELRRDELRTVRNSTPSRAVSPAGRSSSVAHSQLRRNHRG